MPAAGSVRATSFELLEELSRYPIVPARQAGLGRARRLLHELGDPQQSFRSVSVVGSAGKGSTATMIASILMASNRKTGLIRSPHLFNYTERIEVDGQDISVAAWEHAFGRVWSVVERMQGNTLPGCELGRPSFSEVLFALAALYFAEQGVEWATLEAGMGARFDATNTVWPSVAILTNVSLEHTSVLGHTVTEIAREKAAVFKSGSRGVTAAEGEALDIIRERCTEESVPLLEIPGDIDGRFVRDEGERQLIELDGKGVRLPVRLRMLGVHQISNAASAFGAALQLRDVGLEMTEDAIRRGLEQAWLPGRIEIVPGSPSVLMDGAQSVAGSARLAQFLDAHSHDGKRALLFAAMSDKDARAMAQNLAPFAETVVVTRVPGTDRSMDPVALAEAFRSVHRDVVVEADAQAGFRLAEKIAGHGGQIVVAGSLYLIGAVRSRVIGEGSR